MSLHNHNSDIDSCNNRHLCSISRRNAAIQMSRGLTSLCLLSSTAQAFHFPEKSNVRPSAASLESIEYCSKIGQIADKKGLISLQELSHGLDLMINNDQKKINSLIHQDYIDLNLTTVEGWVLSKTEVILYAALGRLSA